MACPRVAVEWMMKSVVVLLFESAERRQRWDEAGETMEEMLLLLASLLDWLASFSRSTFIACHQVGQGVAGVAVSGELVECFHRKPKHLSQTLVAAAVVAAAVVVAFAACRGLEFQPNSNVLFFGIHLGVELGFQQQLGAQVNAVVAAAVMIKGQSSADGDQVLSGLHRFRLVKQLGLDPRPFLGPKGEQCQVF